MRRENPRGLSGRPYKVWAVLSLVASLTSCGQSIAAIRRANPEAVSSGLAIQGTYRLRQAIAVPHPGFLALSGAELLVSSFDPWGQSDGVRRILGVREALVGGPGAVLAPAAQGIAWPNEPLPGLPEPFPQGSFLVPSGFLVPGKVGNLSLVAPDGIVHPLGKPHDGWFYHRAALVDLDGDGRCEVLAARARKPMIGAASGELVCFRAPARPFQDPWQEQVLVPGPDVNFRLADLDWDGRPEVVATEFFGRSLSVCWQDTAGHWARRVVDTTLGSAFDLDVSDLLGTGQLAAVVTNHESDGKGAVFAYEIPRDFRTSSWPRHTLMAGIKAAPGFQSAAPGAPMTFLPGPGSKRRAIAVSGDGAGKAWVLAPSLGFRDPWSFDVLELTNSRGTVGSCLPADLDGDGTAEVAVALYDQGKIELYGAATRRK